MEMTYRIRQILIYLLRAEHPVTDGEVAEALGVSKRTILREADYLSYVLAKYNLTLSRKKGEGSRIEGDAADKERLLSYLSESDGEGDPATDRALRRRMLTLELLRSREPQKLFYFSNLFGVSEATISSDLDAIEEWAAEQHLAITRKPGYGVFLAGGEREYRSALQHFISDNMGGEQLKAIDDNIYRIMNEEVLSGVGDMLEDIDEPYIARLTNDAYIGLLIHIAIAVERIRLGSLVEESVGEAGYDAQYDVGYEAAKRIADMLEERFDITVPESEVNNILLHIKGAKLRYSSEAIEHSGYETEELLSIIDAMIDTFDPEFAGELKSEDGFVEGLLVHLEPVLYRVRNNMVIHNPLLAEIRAEYPKVYEDCERAAGVVTERTGLTLNDAEIGYLAMHFGAAREKIESRRTRRRTVTAGVICASGFGVARLMIAKLQSCLSDMDVVLKAYGSDEVTPAIIARTDFFISSINVDRLNVDYVLVSPLITQRDVLQIQVKINEYASMPQKQAESDFTRQLDEVNAIISDVKGVIRRYRNIRADRELSFEQLIDLLSEELAPSKAAAAVVRSELIAREHVMSQIFPELGLALLHCRSRAVKECTAITAIPEGGSFTNERLSPVEAILCMAIPDDDKRRMHAAMMGRISSALIEDGDFLLLIKQGDEDAVRDRLQRILKGFFNEQLSEL